MYLHFSVTHSFYLRLLAFGPLDVGCKEVCSRCGTVQRLQDCHQRWAGRRPVRLPHPHPHPGWTRDGVAPRLTAVSRLKPSWRQCSRLLSDTVDCLTSTKPVCRQTKHENSTIIIKCTSQQQSLVCLNLKFLKYFVLYYTFCLHCWDFRHHCSRSLCAFCKRMSERPSWPAASVVNRNKMTAVEDWSHGSVYSMLAAVKDRPALLL